MGVAGNFTFYYLSIAEGSVAVAATLMYSAPVFVYLVSLVFGFETLSGSKIGAIGLVLLGMILLTGMYDLSASQVTPISVFAGLMASVSYAVFIFGFKSAAPRGGSPQAILVIAFGVLSVVFLHEALAALQILGMVLILLTVTAMATSFK